MVFQRHEKNGRVYFDTLLNLIKKRSHAKATKILENTSDAVHWTNHNGRTLLHYAAEMNNHNIVRNLLRLGAKIDAQDHQGKTALMLSNHYSTIKCLLAHNANIHICDKSGISALQAIMETGCFPRILYRRLADEYCSDSEKIAKKLIELKKCSVYIVIGHNDAQLTRCLLKHGCPLIDTERQQYARNENPLLKAISCNEIENLRALLDHGVGMDTTNPLHCYAFGASQYNLKMLRLLLDRGANPHKIMLGGQMQMANILRNCKRENIRVLLQYNVDLDAKDEQGSTPIHYIIRNTHPNVFEELRGKQFDPNARDNKGSTPLHYITPKHNISVLKLLHDMGADLCAKDNDGLTPLMRLWQNFYRQNEESTKLIDYFLWHGADPQVVWPCQQTDSAFKYSTCSTRNYWINSVIAHLAIIETQGTPIKEFIRNVILKNNLYREHYETCQRQLEEMKQVNVWQSVTLWDIAVASKSQIEHHVRNRQLLLNFHLMKYENDCLPYYQYFIKDRILRTMKIVDMRTKVITNLFEALGWCLDAYSIIADKIISYFTDQDLMKMCCKHGKRRWDQTLMQLCTL